MAQPKTARIINNDLDPIQISLLEPTAANVGFESTLWAMADRLRGNLDSSEYKHVVLGLIFLKYVSDTSTNADNRGPAFKLPVNASWSVIESRAERSDVGSIVDQAMASLEKANPRLKGALPEGYGRPGLDQRCLGQVVRLIGTIQLGEKTSRSRDVLGRVYEYFLSQFASAEGKRGGEFYTPRCVVRLLVNMLAPHRGTVYDPCCGSGGMFIQSEKFIEEQGGRKGDIRIFGQESNLTTWRLARMNLAMRDLEAELGTGHANTFRTDLHKALKADYILANPPFNESDWGAEELRSDERWKYGLPPANNANYAWVQHFIYHLNQDGIAGFVLANGALSSNQGGEGEVRKNIVEADLVDCVVSLPAQLFYSTQIPVSLWFLAKDKASKRYRNRSGSTLFVDARSFGSLRDRTHRELDESEISRIAAIYRAWRGDVGNSKFADIPGFARSVTRNDIRSHKYALVPGRYVGFAPRQWSSSLEDLHDEILEIERRIKEARRAMDDSWRTIRRLTNG
jgi:type I restriction enzyme M protein